jgi:hypothetical protein
MARQLDNMGQHQPPLGQRPQGNEVKRLFREGSAEIGDCTFNLILDLNESSYSTRFYRTQQMIRTTKPWLNESTGG